MIYYLRSRGLDLAAARQLLLCTFAHEVLGRIAFEPARVLAEQLLEQRLGKSGSDPNFLS